MIDPHRYTSNTIVDRLAALEELVVVAHEMLHIPRRKLCLLMHRFGLFSDIHEYTIQRLSGELGIQPYYFACVARRWAVQLIWTLEKRGVTHPQSALEVLFELLNVSLGDDPDLWRFTRVAHHIHHEQRVETILDSIYYKLRSFIRAHQPDWNDLTSDDHAVRGLILQDHTALLTLRSRLSRLYDLRLSSVNHESRSDTPLHVSDRLDLKGRCYGDPRYELSPQVIMVDGQIICIRVDDMIVTHPRLLSEREASLTARQRDIVDELKLNLKFEAEPELLELESQLRELTLDLLQG